MADTPTDAQLAALAGHPGTTDCWAMVRAAKAYLGSGYDTTTAPGAARFYVAYLIAQAGSAIPPDLERVRVLAPLVPMLERTLAEVRTLRAAIARHVETAAREDYASMAHGKPGALAWAELADVQRDTFRQAVSADFWREEGA